jgi:hypothetical protein
MHGSRKINAVWSAILAMNPHYQLIAEQPQYAEQTSLVPHMFQALYQQHAVKKIRGKRGFRICISNMQP